MIEIMKTKTNISKLLVIVSVLTVALVGSGLGASSVAADSDKDSRSYLKVYSEGGTYSSVVITYTGNDDAKACGGRTLSGSKKTVTRKLSVSAGTRFRCSAVAGADYTVSFLRGRGSSAVRTHTVDVDANKCMFVTPIDGPQDGGTNCGSIPAGLHTGIQSHAFTIRPCVNAGQVCATSVTAANAIKPSRGISGKIDIFEVGAADGDNNVGRRFCVTPTVAYNYKDANGAVIGKEYTAKLQYVGNRNGQAAHCTARISRDKPPLKGGASYTLEAGYAGNGYLNGSQTMTPTTFVTK